MKISGKRSKTALRAVLAGLAAILPAAAGAQLFLYDPVFPSGPVEPSDPMVGVPIPGATPAEYRAHLLWNLRSGLNVAALQCQFSPTLRTVSNYNALLDHHSGELASAYNALTGYFQRIHGAREGMRKFDDYSTQTYNNFSTFQAQYGFCQTAAEIAKEALTARKGNLHNIASTRMRELRSSLVPAYDRIAVYNPQLIRMTSFEFLERPDCSQLRGRARRRCEAES